MKFHHALVIAAARTLQGLVAEGGRIIDAKKAQTSTHLRTDELTTGVIETLSLNGHLINAPTTMQVLIAVYPGSIIAGTAFTLLDRVTVSTNRIKTDVIPIKVREIVMFGSTGGAVAVVNSERHSELVHVNTVRSIIDDHVYIQ